MPLVIERTNSWSGERMRPFWPSVIECIDKLVGEFPDDYNRDFVVGEILAGKRDLWIVHDPDEAPKAILIAITHITISQATGRRVLEMSECGGERLKEALSLFSDVEEWAAKEHGIKTARLTGRPGWGRMLRPQGYARRVEVLEKTIGA